MWAICSTFSWRNACRSNEAKQFSSRYLSFDLEQLIKVAVTTVHARGACYCNISYTIVVCWRPVDWLSGTKVLKCQEGPYNRAFIMTMDNGSKVFAKLPCRATEPKHYITASEVATRKFVSFCLADLGLCSSDIHGKASRCVESSNASVPDLVCLSRQSSRCWVYHRGDSVRRALG